MKLHRDIKNVSPLSTGRLSGDAAMFKSLALLVVLTLAAGDCQDNAVNEPPRTADSAFRPAIGDRAFAEGEGPVLFFDEGHNNFHETGGTYSPFVAFIERDGYVVKPTTVRFSAESLAACDILVIADAMPRKHDDEDSTFSKEEVDALGAWVHGGGALFLITDHFPDPFAVKRLAAAFGITVNNGYALDCPPDAKARPIVFTRQAGTLRDHPIAKGRTEAEKVDHVATFAGCAFRAGPDFEPLLVFGKNTKSWMPKKSWEFPPGTPAVDVEGWCQGGVLEWGKGRVAFFGEAAMFTAQIFDEGRVRAGMNHPQAKQSAQFLLNLLHWLSGVL